MRSHKRSYQQAIETTGGPVGLAGGHVAKHQGAAAGSDENGMRDVQSNVGHANETGGAHESHKLSRKAHVVWCRLCGRHAVTRLGVGLRNECRGEATGVYPSRLQRLRQRLHPVTAVPLDCDFL